MIVDDRCDCFFTIAEVTLPWEQILEQN